MEHPTLQDVIAKLRQDGYSDEEVDTFVQEVTKAAFAKLYADLMTTLSDQEIEEIEKCATQDEANAKIKELYAINTGKDARVELDHFLTDVSKELLADMNKSKDQQTGALPPSENLQTPPVASQDPASDQQPKP